MRFTKMHGTANDYIYVDCVSDACRGDPALLARRISDRHIGIGADGLILILPSQRADIRMRMFNADGSEAEMCGNGVRCLAKYVYDRGLVRKTDLRVETGAGVLTLKLLPGPDGTIQRVRVDMGRPRLHPAEIPVKLPGDRALDIPIDIGHRMWQMTCVSMGNPHAVFFVDDLAAVDLEGIGPLVEHHALFPKRTNAHFVRVLSPREVRMRTWERGSGVTQACGTGASAVCVAGALTGRTEREILARVDGGDLDLHWADDDHVFLTGPAVEVFSGDWPD